MPCMPDEEAPASYKADTVEFILNHTRGVPVRQTQTMDALDGKRANFSRLRASYWVSPACYSPTLIGCIRFKPGSYLGL